MWTCGDLYHLACGQIPDDAVKEIERGAYDWRCSKCRTTTSRRSFINMGTDRDQRDSVSSLVDVTDRNNGNLDATFSELKAEIRNLSKVQEASLQSLMTMDKKMEEIQILSKNVKQHDKRLDSLQKSNKSLTSMVKNLTIKLEDGEQKANLNKIFLNGLPFNIDENVNDIVKCTLAIYAQYPACRWRPTRYTQNVYSKKFSYEWRWF